MVLYFIKGDGPSNWSAMKLTLEKAASPFDVIKRMESQGWKSVTRQVYNEWKKKNEKASE